MLDQPPLAATTPAVADRGGAARAGGPPSDAPGAAESGGPSEAPARFRGVRILLVDDEPMVLRVLEQLLSRVYRVSCADGLASASSLLSQDAEFDAILCDMMMLDGTGADLHAWIAEHRPELSRRMIFMTGGTFTAKARAFLASVDAEHLVKPFSLRALDQVIGRILG